MLRIMHSVCDHGYQKHDMPEKEKNIKQNISKTLNNQAQLGEKFF